MTGYLVHCANCYAAIIAYPPRQELEIILVEPCPMCNGLEQNFNANIVFTRIQFTGIKDISFQKQRSSNSGERVTKSL